MTQPIENVKTNVKALLGLETLTSKQELQINIIVDEILQYCYRTELIQEMVNVVSDVVADIMTNSITANGNVQSYSEGDMSISFAVSQEQIAKYQGKLEYFKKIIGLNNDIS